MDEKRHGVNFSEGGTVFRENPHIRISVKGERFFKHYAGNNKLSQYILV